ncbi:hypothetical protein NDU88_002989 [Pleurodeles waltl]|uniref:Uncharacterized protein n=1 Tax=Pleurodeles waltl TaxID=8319 RepID=A0AAV7RH00_PLEWA|nr:hypothetical protein NDU88_002989 [Pleurodeles waltl]
MLAGSRRPITGFGRSPRDPPFHGFKGEEGLQACARSGRPRTAPLGSAAGAQPHRLLVSRTALGLRARPDWAGALGRSSPAGPSGAGSLCVRHVPDPGHAQNFNHAVSLL